MVFPLARDLVGCVRQVCKEIRWELLAIQVLQKEYHVWFYQTRLRFAIYHQNEGVWGVPPRVAYLSSLCVCVCVWRGGVDLLGGGWAEKVCPSVALLSCPAGVGCLGAVFFEVRFE